MRVLSTMLVIGLMSSGLALVNCGSSGPEITLSLNVRDLCQRTVSGEQEDRCVTDDICPGTEFCWRPDTQYCSIDDDCSGVDNHCVNGDCECIDDANCQAGFLCTGNLCLKRGYCRECASDANCAAGACDHGWCHTPCSANAECESSQRCTGDFCRNAHIDGTEFNFCNTGTKDLEVYLDQTKLLGNADACAMAEWAWVPADQTTVTLPPEDCSLYLSVQFTPPDVGDYYAYIEVYSNATNWNPLPLLIHGNVVEAACNENLDAICDPCTAEDATEPYKNIIEDRPEPTCN
ncbi:MAG: hypothetical protein JRJ19_14565 [Deltaproteobacteria bacterium]|nr:hypothetical protein [Deltaproteobacteria bacterium]MBW1873290.1 hypothetical protein [Deltaproteobacteria bacterium]